MLVDPIRYDMVAHRRVEFRDRIAVIGENWTSASVFMQVRPTPDATGTPLLNLTIGSGLAMEYVGTDTVEHHVAAGWLGFEIYSQINPVTGQNYAKTDSVLLSVLGIIVSSSGTAFSAAPAEAKGDPVKCAYDVIVDRDGAGGAYDKQKRFYGDFTIMGTVYQ